MTTRHLRSALLCAVLILFTWPGCNGGGADGDAGGGGDGDAGMGGDDAGTNGDPAGYAWLVTYDLAGSTYFIDALFDFTITVQEPYDENLNMGPGTLTLRFPDVDGQPAPWEAVMVEYSLRQNFVTGIAMAEVTTDLQTTAGPNQSGVAQGALNANILTWTPAEAAPYCRNGQVSCTGSLCGTSGSPPEGAPFVFDNDCTEPLPLNPFVFTGGISDFTMEAVTVSQDSNQTTSLSFVGTETDRQRIPAP
jgi:hypothetical protein